MYSFTFKAFFITSLVVLSFVSFCRSAPRVWTSKTGSTIEASLERRSGDRVTLVTKKGRKITVKIADLSNDDQAFLNALLIKEHGSKIPGIEAKPGAISGPIKCEDSKWTYHVYLPKKFHLGRKWPVWFILSPSGGAGGGLLNRYIKGADTLGCILAGSVESRNRFSQAGSAMKAMAEDVYKRFPVVPKFAFSSGFSGGARGAFWLAGVNSDVVGVLACGAGYGPYSGGKSRSPKLRAKTYVYSLIGSNCFNRTGSYKTHKKLGKQSRLRFFIGNHDWANQDLLEQGMVRVVGQAILNHRSLEPYKEYYLPALKSVTEQLKESSPWESHYLASFGKDMDGIYDQGYFAKLAAQLAKNPKVVLAQQAESDIKKLCERFYIKYDYFSGDRNELPKRAKAGIQLSEPYESIPHGKILKKLGEKCR